MLIHVQYYSFMRRKNDIQESHKSQGDENLEIMLFAPRYTSYIGALISKKLPSTGNLLELGSGDGTQTSKVIAPNPRLICVEPSPLRRNSLSKAGYMVSEDLTSHVGSNASALFTINCLEHIEEDLSILITINMCLKKGGAVIIFVPALPALYSKMDQRVGHYRRYTKKSIESKLTESGFAVSSFEYVDSIGVMISLLYKLLPGRSGEPSIRSIALYDRLVFPLSRILDRFFNKFVGKNILVCGVKEC